MRKRILNIVLIVILSIMMIALTGCTDETSNGSDNNQNISVQENAGSENVNVIKHWKTLTMENMQENVGEHMKWFYAAYIGEIYGWYNIYEYKDVTDTAKIPGVNNNEVYIYELVGAKSKKDMEDSLAKYVSRDKFSKLTESMHISRFEYFLDGLIEYNGNVYWLNHGVGGGYYMSNPRITSIHNEITKIKIDSYASLGEMLEETITLTFEYSEDTDSFLIIDWEVESHF